MLLDVDHGFFCVKLLFFSVVSDTETGWEQYAKPDIRAIVKQLYDVGERSPGFGDSCSVVWKGSNSLPVMSDWSTGACPLQHLDTVLEIVEFRHYRSWFSAGSPWSQASM